MTRGLALLCAIVLAGCARGDTVKILSHFGSLTGVTGGYRDAPHMGVDFDAVNGDPVIAAADGVIGRVTEHNGCAAVRHRLSDGRLWVTNYCHMDRIDVSPGQRVKRGESLGAVGTRGRSMGVPHVHFELWKDDLTVRVDPLPFIVGCFDPGGTHKALDTGGETARPVLTYPINCGRR